MVPLRIKLVRGGRPRKPPIKSVSDVIEYVARRIARDASETMLAIVLDNSNVPLGFLEFRSGQVRRSTLAPGEIVKAALLANASGVILAHNHPSGSVKFSRSDYQLTKMVAQALRLVGIELLDHLVVAPASKGAVHASMRELGDLPIEGEG